MATKVIRIRTASAVKEGFTLAFFYSGKIINNFKVHGARFSKQVPKQKSMENDQLT